MRVAVRVSMNHTSKLAIMTWDVKTSTANLLFIYLFIHILFLFLFRFDGTNKGHEISDVFSGDTF